MADKLIKDYNNIQADTFEDYFMAIAKNIEESLLQSGATPGKDYNIIDLYKLAQPFVLEQFKKNKISIAVSW